jgi:hypothetical protein
MIHRMALRVLPSLSQAVTTAEVRKRKRIVMLLSGLVAFGLYRAAKQAMPIADIWVLLALNGLVCCSTAIGAYAAGRRLSIAGLWREDEVRWLAWIVGWVGFTYGVQLSLMVLALLKVIIQYDFLQHPDGPAMMAMIIASTSVARDAFELGHVRRLQQAAEPIVTFPDGATLRTFVGSQMRQLAWPVALTAVLTALVAILARGLGVYGSSELGQLIVVSTVAGTLALVAYLLGKQPGNVWLPSLTGLHWADLFRFWWWPGLAFAATYYLSLQGLLVFVIGTDLRSGAVQAGLAAGVAGAMWLYGWYLGVRRSVEDRLFQRVPATLLRCPFVLGLLSKGNPAVPATPGSDGIMLGEGRRG